MNEPRFLFVFDMIVVKLLDEDRRTYSLCRICVLSLIILLALRSTCFSYKVVREDCLKPVIVLLMFTIFIYMYVYYIYVYIYIYNNMSIYTYNYFI